MSETFKADEIQFSDAMPTGDINFNESPAPVMGPGGDNIALDENFNLQPGAYNLDAPIPGIGDALMGARTGLEKASEFAGKFYAEQGLPKLGKFSELGGKFTAGMIPAQMKDALLMAITGPLLAEAATVGKAAVGSRPIMAARDAVVDVAAMVFNKSPEVIQAIYNKPGAMWKAATKAFSLKHQERLINVIDQGLSKAGSKIGELEEAFSGFFGTGGAAGKSPDVMLRGTFDKTKFEMLKKGYRLPDDIAQGLPMPKLGKLPESATESKYLVETLTALKNSPRMSWGEALNLKRQINKSITYGIEGSTGLQPVGTDANRILKGLVTDLDDQLAQALPKDVRPQWKEANKLYSEARDAYSELKKQVVMGRHTGTENQLKAALTRGEYDDAVLRRAEKLGSRAEKMFNALRDRLAAQEFKKWAVAGSNAMGQGQGLMGTSFIPSSPRLGGYGIAGASELSGLAGGLGNYAVENPQTVRGVVSGLDNLRK